VIAGGDIGTLVQMPGGEWRNLEAELEAAGIPEAELRELATALTADREAVARTELGPATERWIGRVTARIESGLIELTGSAGGGVIAGIVLRYLGLA
jgi:hypothetical protein